MHKMAQLNILEKVSEKVVLNITKTFIYGRTDQCQFYACLGCHAISIASRSQCSTVNEFDSKRYHQINVKRRKERKR